MRGGVCLVVLATVLVPRVAQADDTQPPPRSPLAIGAAFVPGVVVHGSGSWVLGQRKTATTLLAAEGIGLGLLGTGLAGLALTGASRRVVAPLALVSMTGAALFTVSALADLYGVIGPAGGTPLRTMPWIETRAGVFGVHDPTLRQGLFTTVGLDARHGPFRVSPSAWIGGGESTRRLRLEGAYRFTGPTTTAATSPGVEPSWVDLELALTSHDMRREDVTRTTGEVWVSGRYAMSNIGPSLRGSFAEGAAGLGLASVAHTRDTDTDTLLLGRFGYGFYLGAKPRGDVTAYYEHRRDGIAGGMKIPGIGAGYLGSVGARGRVYLDERFGVAVDVQAGSAAIAGVSLLFREGGGP